MYQSFSIFCTTFMNFDKFDTFRMRTVFCDRVISKGLVGFDCDCFPAVMAKLGFACACKTCIGFKLGVKLITTLLHLQGR